MPQQLPDYATPLDDKKAPDYVIRLEPHEQAPSTPQMNFAVVNGQQIKIPAGMGPVDSFIARRIPQLAGKEPGILNPDPEQNPLMLKSVLPDTEASPGMFGAARHFIYQNLIQPMASPLGILGTMLDANPPTEPIGLPPELRANSVLGLGDTEAGLGNEMNIRSNPQTGETWSGDSPLKVPVGDGLDLPPLETIKSPPRVPQSEPIKLNPVADPGAYKSADAANMLQEALKAPERMNMFGPKVKAPKGILHTLAEINGFGKSMMASIDMSAPLRQGLPLIHRKEWWNALFEMPKMFGNQEFYRASMDSILADPWYKTAYQNGLSLTDIGTSNLTNKEEAFMSHVAEKYVPGVRQSEQAYVGFLNKLRFDTYKNMLQKAVSIGMDPKAAGPEIARFVNIATGRGSLGQLESSAVALNQLMFSPRMLASRLTMLNPAFYLKASPATRRQALKSLFAYAGATSAFSAMIDEATNGEVPHDVTSHDFMKIKIGHTTLDPYAGFQQPIVTAARFLEAVYDANNMDPATYRKTYGPFKKDDAGNVLLRFGRSKASPLSSFAIDLALGKDYGGNSTHWMPNDISDLGLVGSRVVPLLIQDMMDLIHDDPDSIGLKDLLVVPAGLGVGMQTYPPRKKKE